MQSITKKNGIYNGEEFAAISSVWAECLHSPLRIDPFSKKEDVKAELKDGYLTIRATANTSKDEKGSDGRYIRRERYSGSCSRSFYVGDAVTEQDIKAKFEDGTLKMLVPKAENRPAVEDKKYIPIEG